MSAARANTIGHSRPFARWNVAISTTSSYSGQIVDLYAVAVSGGGSYTLALDSGTLTLNATGESATIIVGLEQERDLYRGELEAMTKSFTELLEGYTAAVQASVAAAVATTVLMKARAAMPLASRLEPALKPNQPTHSSEAPTIVSVRLCGVMCSLP